MSTVPDKASLEETKINMDTVDEFINSSNSTLIDQYGKTRKTLAGIEEVWKINVRNVTSPYTATTADVGGYIVFDHGDNAILNIDDNMSIGDTFLTANVGLGAVILTMTGNEELRGESLVADSDSFASATKIHSNYWQSSERS